MLAESLFIVFLGAPGAGKGTQAKLLEKELGLLQISTGDIFRKNLQEESELGLLAKSYMDKGELVPDGVTVAMVKERLSHADCAKGALLDGFPRTVAQAEALADLLADLGKRVALTLYLKVPDEILLQRLSGRWICRNCGAVYHTLFSPPKVAGVCDLCGGELYQRPDDKVETAQNRLRVYFEQTAPVIEYYDRLGLLREIDGTQSIEEVHHALLTAIGEVDCQ